MLPSLTHVIARFAEIPDYDGRMNRIKDLVLALPPGNKETLEYLAHHLARVGANGENNKMLPTNLAIVFGPTLLRPEVETMSSIMNMGAQSNLVENIINAHEWMFS